MGAVASSVAKCARVVAISFIAPLALGLFAPAHAADPQGAEKVHRIGFLAISPLDPQAAETQRIWDAFNQGLRERGWVEGKNIVIERRS